ncbi:antitermination protein Q [Pseudomonas sp. GW456-L14]|uniref:antiterminator Q family protein n=1 Tax=unclassified Pseudomonas TaxID=196821 RepID=UPI000C880C79|nr:MULTISPECIES: antiterminator Q family protein [unclassified Pseudomonas]PMY37341.1 antitermination protein Q [Pseudomonas sp. GW456-L14]PMY59342.1 antitermination protein Q [Pseudomonas sp. GW456-L12]
MKKRTYFDKPLGDTEYLLEQWGWWRMDGMGVPGYVSQLAAVMSQRNPVKSMKAYVITDDVALVVDQLLARLIKRDQQMGDFVWLYFGSKWPANRIGRENSMSERKAWELIKAGVGWIDGALDQSAEAA